MEQAKEFLYRLWHANDRVTYDTFARLSLQQRTAMKAAAFYNTTAGALEALRAQGLYRSERRLSSPQSPMIRVAQSGIGAAGAAVVNAWAYHYLGLAHHPEV